MVVGSQADQTDRRYTGQAKVHVSTGWLHGRTKQLLQADICCMKSGRWCGMLKPTARIPAIQGTITSLYELAAAAGYLSHKIYCKNTIRLT